jgi:murein DD-endopeptidase MepM/ murein hydrolase activator NlpD
MIAGLPLLEPWLRLFNEPAGVPGGKGMKAMWNSGLPQLFILLIWVAGLSGAAPGLRVTHQARSLQPGEVVLVTLESPKPLGGLYGTVFGKRFSFYAGANPRIWRGLIGIDLETARGRYPLQLRGTLLDGEAVRAVHTLDVRDKKFATRRLTVDEQYVTPPKALEERIANEAKLLAEVFAAVTPEKRWQGPFVVPVPARPNSNFGRRSILNGKPRSPHTGIDFPADAGTPIRAPNSGRVVLAADLYYSGNTVILDHGLGLYSFFAHLSRFSVHDGDVVKTGGIVGRVGSTGRSTGPHLHWTVRLVGTRVDPLSLMAALSSDPR